VCGDTRPIAGDGLCYKCYYRVRRAREFMALAQEGGAGLPTHDPDRSQSKAQRNFNRWRIALSQMIRLLDESMISSLVLPQEAYESIKTQLLAAIERCTRTQQEEQLNVDLRTEQKAQLAANPETQLAANWEADPLAVPTSELAVSKLAESELAHANLSVHPSIAPDPQLAANSNVKLAANSKRKKRRRPKKS
jgi:hypothetical protein